MSGSWRLADNCPLDGHLVARGRTFELGSTRRPKAGACPLRRSVRFRSLLSPGRASTTRITQGFLSPLVEAGTASSSCLESCSMNAGGHAQHELATCGLLWRATKALAGCNVVVYGRVEVCLELRDRFTVERNDVVDVENSPDNDLVFGIEGHAGDIASVGHRVDHGLAPIRSNNCRTALTR